MDPGAIELSLNWLYIANGNLSFTIIKSHFYSLIALIMFLKNSIWLQGKLVG